MGAIDEKKERALVAEAREKAHTLIYVIFTECATENRGVTQPFISFQYHSDQVPFDNSAELKAIKEVLDFFSYEYLTPVYDPKNISAVIRPVPPGQQPTSMSLRTRLQAQLKKLGFAEKEEFKATHPVCRLNGNPVTDSILGHMVARKALGNSVAILNLGGFLHHSPTVDIEDIHHSQKVTVDILYNIKGMHKWLADNRNPKRKYTFNPKHGDSSKKARDGYAQLKTSDKETNALLRVAVGESRESPLWYYDKDRGEYIYFENQDEWPPNFHGYHVKEGEENYENINIEKLLKVQPIP